ncbi:MAG: efflux RND transporter permease subunit, partial [Gammaproteobacteria bacterium]|nr:efflux RND transporter permease subunit [Gammaproteobacteria bacterium]
AHGFTEFVAVIVGVFGWLFRKIGQGMRLLLTPLVIVFQGFYRLSARLYRPTLGWSLNNRIIVVLVAAAIFAATMTLVPRLGTELIPQMSQGEFDIDIRLAPGAPIEQTDLAIRRARAIAAGLDDVSLTYSVAGTGSRLDASPVDAGENSGTLHVRLAADADRAAENRVIEAMREGLSRIAGVQFEFSRPELFTFSTPLEIEIAGYELDQLERVSRALMQRMEDSGRFTDLRTTIETGNPEVQIQFDQDKAARLGLSVRDIADRVVAKVRGELATRYTWRDRKIDVLVRSVDERDASIDDIRRLIVNPESSRPVTLEAVADIRIARGPTEIRRADQERVALIFAAPLRGDLGSAVERIETYLDEAAIPAGVAVTVTGQSSDMQESFASMQFALALAVFLVYLVMAAQFESVIHPFVILFTIPLALVGAVGALALTGTAINVVVLIGVIMLAGIVVNNAIVLVDLVNQLRAAGADKNTALRQAGAARLRPILMTTATTALGLLPMAIGFGEGAEVRAPMAITVIGGLLVSTLLTLVVIPVVYSLLAPASHTQLDTAVAAESSS